VKPFTCFLVDDDTDDQEIFLKVMRNIDPAIRNMTAVNGVDALKKLNATKENPDLIFLDLNMPLMNGKEFLQALYKLRKFSTIPVVILSTTSDTGTIAETLELGAKHFITKPDTFSDWETALKIVLEEFPRDGRA
jgi:CheY-like chemotaxis protein